MEQAVDSIGRPIPWMGDPATNPDNGHHPETEADLFRHAATDTEAAGTLWTKEDYLAARERLAPVEIQTQQGQTLRLGEQSEMTLLWGRSGAGKTWLAMWMAERLAAAGIRSLMLVTEGYPTYLDRLPEWNWPNNLTPGIRRISRHDLQLPQGASIIADAQRCGAVFLDVVSALFSNYDENSSSAWNTTRELLNPIIGDRLFVAVHHSGKPQRGESTLDYPASPRGTSRLIDDAAYDYVMKGHPSGRGAYLKAGSKSRGLPHPFEDELLFKFTDQGVIERNNH